MDKNEPAFPFGIDSSIDHRSFYHPGMTLLEYTAIKVMQSLLTLDDIYFNENNKEKDAKTCYDIAEAMMKERDKRMGK